MSWMHENEMNEQLLDQKLNSEGQQLVRLTLKAMPEDVPSMAWRGELNARVMAQAAKNRSRRRLWLFVSPSVGLAAAAALGLVLLLPHPSAPAPVGPVQQGPSLEAQLLASHSDTVMTQDVVGSGLSSQEVQQSSSDDPDAQDDPAS